MKLIRTTEYLVPPMCCGQVDPLVLQSSGIIQQQDLRQMLWQQADLPQMEGGQAHRRLFGITP